MTLMEYVEMMRKRWVLMTVIVAISCAAAVYAGNRFSEPAYQAASQLIVGKTDAAGNILLMDQADMAANIMLINTYKELIKSPPILKQVAKRYPRLQLTVEELRTKLKVTTAAGSQIMGLSFEDKSYARASQTVNAVTQIFIHETPGILKVQNVRVLSESDPTAAPSPEQTPLMLYFLIAFVASAVVAAAVAFLLETFDESMKQPKDVEKAVGLTVIAAIPDIRKADLKHLKQTAAYKRVGEETHVHVNG